MDDINTESTADEDFFENFTSKSTNDPWKPQKNNTNEFPKICAAPDDPLKTMISSETYVELLEKRLNHIKGKSDSLKPKDMIQSLHVARDLHVSQYMSNGSTELFSDDSISEISESVMSSIQRRLNPEKQALNLQELVPLVHEDILSKNVEEDIEKTEELAETKKDNR